MSKTGQRLKERRKAIGMSADEVAAELGVSRSTIFRYENGYIEKVPANVIEELACILHTTPSYLIGWEDDPHDWERIGNDEGIHLSNDSEGSYEDCVKYKVMQESDDVIDSYYETYNRATDHLKSLGCQVKDIEGSDKILIETPNGERLEANMDDLIYNFMVFGTSQSGVKKLITPRKIVDLRNDEDQLLANYNLLNQSGQLEAQKRIEELAMIPVYKKVLSALALDTEVPEHLILNAAHERTDIDVTDEMRQHDDDIMNDPNF